MNLAQRRLARLWLDLLGPFPAHLSALEPEIVPIKPIGGVPAFHVSFNAEEGDRVTAYLLVPHIPGESNGPWPAVICPHSTTQGAGKGRIVGLSGSLPGSAPDPPSGSRAYGLELALRGYTTLCPDLICDGERVLPGDQPYDTRHFYQKHPGWSAMGKNAWDVMRCVDFLRTLPYVDTSRIACLGHSLGGHTALFAAAFDPCIAAVVSNCGALDWQLPADHWSRKPDAGSGPVESYVYIPRFRRYIEDPALDPPVDFQHLMMMVAPRPLLLMASENEATDQRLLEKVEEARAYYLGIQAPDRISTFTFEGGHAFPSQTRNHAYAWLGEVLKRGGE